MPAAPAKTADEIASNVKNLIDRIIDADLASQIGDTGRDVASTVADVGGTAAQRAGDAARDVADATERVWRKGIGRTLGDLWNRRTVALGAAGAAVPASRELVEAAAERLGIRRREESHWGNFFVGLILGIITGAVIAILTAPRAGREIRDELAARAREAGDWVPVFQRGESEGDGAGDGAGGQGAPGEVAEGPARGARSRRAVAPAEESPIFADVPDEEQSGGRRG